MLTQPARRSAASCTSATVNDPPRESMPRAGRPWMVTTGLLRAAARAADMNLRPAETSSNCTRIDCVSGSPASQSRRRQIDIEPGA
jgi:hypothetical protein